MDKLKFWNLLHAKERHEAIYAMSNWDFVKFNTYSILLAAFIVFAPLTLMVNLFIIYYLYKSILAVFIGVVLVYLIVLFFAIGDFLYIKWTSPVLLQYKRDFIKFYNIIAVIASVAAIIYILIEVL